MINPIFLLSGVGMMLVGIISAVWWRYRTLVHWRYFFLGAAVWMAAIAVKVALDLTVTPLIIQWLTGIYTAVGIAMISGAYVGLRTGLLESGFTYAVAMKEKLRKMDFDQAVAFGIGFGAMEAVMLGLSSFLNVAVLLAFPQILNFVTPLQRAAILQQLTLPAVLFMAPIIERASTLLVHVFCTVLVIKSVKSGRAGYFILSILYRTLIDGALPFLTMTFDSTTIAGIYYIESFVVVLGLMAAVGMFWIRHKYPEKKGGKSKRISLFYVAALVLLIVTASFIAAQPNVASKLERRNVNFDGLKGSYDFIMNGSKIGSTEFEFTGGTEYEGKNAFVIEETVNLSGDDYEMYVEGVLYATVDARPLFYNTTIHKNGDERNILCRFGEGFVEQSTTAGNYTDTFHIPYDEDAFLIANNMISHWALMFRAAKLEPKQTYIAHLYSPDAGMDIARSFEISGVENILIKGRNHEVYVFKENTGNMNYVTPQGELLKIGNPVLEIVISDGEPEEGGLFR